MEALKVKMQSLWWVFMMTLSLTACDALGAEGNIGISIFVAVLVVIALGWFAVKFMGGILKMGVWGIVMLVLLIIGFIAWIIFRSMG